jgi:hypothetical protein
MLGRWAELRETLSGRLFTAGLLLCGAAALSGCPDAVIVSSGGSAGSAGGPGGAGTAGVSGSAGSNAVCQSASDCADPGTECMQAACNSGQCAAEPSPEGTLAGDPHEGDCKKAECNGAGAIVAVPDKDDLPDDVNDCTEDTCTAAGEPSHLPLPKDTPCGQGLKCDYHGECTGCGPGQTACNGVCVDLSSSPQNCGACGHDCLGGACVSHACQPVVLTSGQDLPTGIAVDETNVYWVNYFGGTVVTIPKGGGAPVILAEKQDSPRAVAVDATHVYWTNLFGGSVARILKTGGAVETLIGGLKEPSRLALDTSHVYWTEADSIGKIAKQGGLPTYLAVGQQGPEGIAVDANNVYWASYQGKAVRMTSKLGGVAQTLATVDDLPRGLAIDAVSVFWTNSGLGNGCGGGLATVPIGGGSLLELHQTKSCTFGVAVDSTYAYWVDTSGKILRVLKQGGGQVELAVNQKEPFDITVDDHAIYWTNAQGNNGGQDTIMKLAK